MAFISSEELFAVWTSDRALWSQWAKPIAFAQAGALMTPEGAAEPTLPAVPGPLSSNSAVVVDLPGAAAVQAGLALADRGFRPVPLFNGTSGFCSVIDVGPIERALAAGADRLKRIALADDAPPAFLLDSRRRGGPSDPSPGSYDNRWIALPQDFPSGALLASRGINEAVLIQSGSLAIPPDLAHVLRRWKESGLQIRVIDLASGQVAADVAVPEPSRFKLAWYTAIALFGLRRSNVGGFGSMIPEETARSGFYG